jgi:hypothetical protein
VTAASYPEIRSDGPNPTEIDGVCGAEIGGLVGDRTTTQIRAHRRTDGWHTRPGDRDICPACWKAGHR